MIRIQRDRLNALAQGRDPTWMEKLDSRYARLPSGAGWTSDKVAAAGCVVLVSIRGRFNVGRPHRPYAWAVESDDPYAVVLLQRAVDDTVNAVSGFTVDMTGEADDSIHDSLAQLRQAVGVELPPRLMNLTIPQLMRSPVASALVAAARKGRTAQGELSQP